MARFATTIKYILETIIRWHRLTYSMDQSIDVLFEWMSRNNKFLYAITDVATFNALKYYVTLEMCFWLDILRMKWCLHGRNIKKKVVNIWSFVINSALQEKFMAIIAMMKLVLNLGYWIYTNMKKPLAKPSTRGSY